ncbi:uracil-DNA glycosylase [Massilia endophytica]|uniref:uracil-DNA glycosylase n=1 Tax=Massilia endophytica TaxID=2899220 RepID=UPI001E30C88A|nr:uracil-DNA glycosylase [Massilia endophytica]UGQ48060.1 uracil-DNA glycosylase [Massilia endophytica]
MAHRTAVFLDEMGIGTRWVLRQRAGDESPQPQEEPAPELAPASAGVPAQPQAAPEARMQPVPDKRPAHAAPGAAEAPPQATSPAARSAVPAGEDSTAWFDDAPAPAPVPRQPAPAARHAPADDAWADEAPPVTAAPRPRQQAPQGVSDDEIAAMDWPTLRTAVSSCTRCNLCRTRVAAVPGRGDGNASWIMLGTMPNAEDESAIEAIAGEPGILLDNMLRAVGQGSSEGAYITSLVKCRPSNDDGSDRLPSADELAACRPYLERELQLAQPKVMVTLGQTSAKGLFGSAARGTIRGYAGVPVVATYHPAELLRRTEDKGKAWADLCLAKAAHAGRR